MEVVIRFTKIHLKPSLKDLVFFPPTNTAIENSQFPKRKIWKYRIHSFFKDFNNTLVNRTWHFINAIACIYSPFNSIQGYVNLKKLTCWFWTFLYCVLVCVIVRTGSRALCWIGLGAAGLGLAFLAPYLCCVILIVFFPLWLGSLEMFLIRVLMRVFCSYIC